MAAKKSGSDAASKKDADPKRGATSKKDAAPKKQGRLRQMWVVFTLTRKHDPTAVWWMLASLLGSMAVGLLIGWLIDHAIYVTVLGALVGITLALAVLARRAERAAFAQIAGQPGAAAAALQNLRRGWTVGDEPVAVDPRTQDLVFRAIGRPGVVLITEGPLPRVNRLVEQERKRVNRVLGTSVPVHVVHAGDGEGQTELRKLARALTRLRGALTKAEVSEVSKRLRALGTARPPIPKGVDPFRIRPDRRATRGR